MLFLLLACQSTKDDSGLQESVIEEQEEGNGCFSSAPPDPFLVYATPYDDDGNQANRWHLQPKDGETIDFTMGRAISGQVHIAQDGSWGAVAQQDGTVGIFRYENGAVSVLEENLTVQANGEDIYAGTLWLDSQKGELWITDPNWPDNGGGLFRATLDCESGTITGAQKLFSSKNGYAMHSFGENRVYLGRELNNEPYQLSIFDESGQLIAQGNAFDDDESIFSALASDGSNILAADNNEFSSIPTRVSHVVWDEDTLQQEHIFDVEDPVGIVMLDDWAFIASGYGNAVWEYQISTQSIRSVMDIPLPSSILNQNGAVYVAGNTQINRIEVSSAGFDSTQKVLERSGVGGIIGALGVFGAF